MATPDRSEAPAIVPAPRANPDEVPALRTESSQTFDNHDGTLSTDFYTDPIFYKPTGSQTFVPIAVGFAPATDASDAVAVSRDAPVAVAIGPAQADAGFLRLTTADQTVAFALPSASRPQATTVDPRTDGPVADYPDFLPGVDLRVFARAFGAKSFFIWHEAPIDPTITIRVLAPGLTLRLGDDGAIVFVDSDGKQFGRMPAPFAVDSSVDPERGGGIFTDKVSYQLAADGSSVTIAVDPTWLKSATYPVFVDPTFNVDNAGSSSYGDAHTASAFPTTNYADYQRPDSPFYHELWLGDDPSGTSGTSAAYLRWNVSSLNYTSITEATLHIYPYHQFSNAPTSSLANVKRVTTSWIETDPKWNNKPGSDPAIVASAYCVEATTCDFDLQSLVEGWADASYSNFGMKLEEPSGQSYWKRLIASEQGGVHTENLHATYHTISGASTTAAFGSTISWTFTDGVGDPQARYRVQVASDAAYTNILADSGLVNSSASNYLPAPPVTPLADDTLYYYRFRVGDTQGLTDWVTGSWRNDAYRRGDETYYASTPFELNGGLRLDVGAHNGEARISRDLFSIPSFGPPGELSLAYSSLDSSSAGRFGVGWSSNLTQYLSFATGIVEWHRPDGGRVGFSGANPTWTVAGGHFETLTYDGVAHTYTVIRKDQTKLVFQDASPGRLLKIQNRFGKSLTLVWNTSSATATDTSSRVTSIVIDSANNRITGVTDSAGRVWGFAYTGTDLTTLTDPASKTTTFGYDASHHITTITRVRTKAGGGTDTIAWTIGYTSGKATTVLDPIGAATAGTPAHNFTYNPGSTVAGLLKTYPATVVRNTTTYTLDPFGRPTAGLDPVGYTVKQTFDVRGNLLSIDRPVDLSPATWATTTYTYDSAGNPLTETVPQANASDLVLTVMTYNATNDLLTRSENDNWAAEKAVTLNTYDGPGHLTITVENCTTSGTTPPAAASSCTAAGTHDGSTNLTTTYLYTANDQVDVEWDARGYATKRQYDANGNETATIDDCTTAGTTAPIRGTSCSAAGTHDAQTNVTTTATFDLATRDGKAGLPGTETDPTGAVTTNAFDAMERQTSEVLPGDATIPVLTRTRAYDEFGETLTATESWPGLSPSRVTTDVYDLRGRRTNETDPAGGATSSTYDAAGDDLTSTNGGTTTTRLFDGLGNATSEILDQGGFAVTTLHTFNGQGVETVTTPSGTSTTRNPDLAARITQSTIDPQGLNLSTTIDYGGVAHTGTVTTTEPGGLLVAATSDRLRRTIQTVTSHGTLSLIETTTFDASRNAVSQSAPHASGAGIVTTTMYDPLNRATVVVANDVASPTGTDQDVTTTSYYDGAGRSVAIKDPAGIVTRSFYNPRGLASTTIANCTNTGTTAPADPATCAGTGTADASTNVVTTATYDGSGAVVSTTTSSSSGNVLTATSYNAAGQVTSLVIDQGGLNLNSLTYYDNSGLQVAVKDPRGIVTRTVYDTAGRVSKTIENCTNSGTTPPADPATCMGSGTVDASWNVTTAYAYDGRGNKTSEIVPNGRVTVFAYDAADRLMSQTENHVGSITQPDQELATSFYYDPTGNQAAVKVPTTDRSTFSVTRYLYDDLGRLTNEIRNCTDTGTTPPSNPATCAGTGTRDASTNLEAVTANDDHGNKMKVTSPSPAATSGTALDAVVTRYAYDGEDRLCRVMEGSTQNDAQWAGLADRCSSSVSGTAATDVSTRYTYDIDGNLVSMVDGNGNATAYFYDKTGRMTSLFDADGKTLAWGYDVRGNRTNQTNRTAGQSVAWTYDHADRMATRTADGVTVTYGYDASGNRTSAGDGMRTISTTFDAVNRPLSVATSDDAGAATSSTYNFTTPSWSDPTGSYSAVLDMFGRQTSLTDPIHTGSPFATTFRADGQPATVAAPNGNTVTFGYSAAGQPTSSTTLGAGSVNRATYGWILNRAGSRLSENGQVAGDPTNGTTTYAYDALGRLTGYVPPAAISTQAYSWQPVPNRATLQIGASPVVTTTYDNANRPTVDSTGGSYSNDFDGRLTAMPGQTMTYDSLGRLTGVAIAGVTSSYSYDPLDRLRTVTRSGAVQRFRYVGGTTDAAQILDASGTVLRSIANDWTGTRLVDWTGSGSNQRFYGTNGHQDVTWVADSTGALSATLRYDPWGVLRASTGVSLPDFRFQGSWFDTATNLSWAVARWYIPALGRFLGEDDLLGGVNEPASRHRYAYGAGEPISRIDPAGLFWYRWRAGDSAAAVAGKYLGGRSHAQAIYNLNRNRLGAQERLVFDTGECIWVPRTLWFPDRWEGVASQCQPRSQLRPGDILTNGDSDTIKASRRFLGSVEAWYLLTPARLWALTAQATKRARNPSFSLAIYRRNEDYGNDWATSYGQFLGSSSRFAPAGVTIRRGALAYPPPGNSAATLGHYVYVRDGVADRLLRGSNPSLLAHEYIHVLQWQGLGKIFFREYVGEWSRGTGPSNPLEAPAYVWGSWINYYSTYGEDVPWRIFRPLP